MISTAKADVAPEFVAPVSRKKILFRRTGWVLFTIVCLLGFTIVKLPEDRVRNYIDGTISSLIAEKGMTFTTSESHLSYLFGVSYQLKGITLNFPPPSPPARIELLEFKPFLAKALMKRYGGKFYLENTPGKLSGSITLNKNEMDLSFETTKLSLDQLKLMPMVLGIQGAGNLEGHAALSGDLLIPNTLAGSGSLRLSRVALDQQTLLGFAIPKLDISEIQIDYKIDKNRLILNQVQLGKMGNPSDDIQGKFSGEIILGKDWGSTNLNLKAQFSFSENLMRAFVFLDSLLGAGKQADGSYAFNIGGTARAPVPSPVR